MKLLDKYWLFANIKFNEIFKIDENDLKTRERIIEDYRESKYKLVFYPYISAAAFPFCIFIYFLLIYSVNNLFIIVVITTLVYVLTYSDGKRWLDKYIKKLEKEHK